MQDADRIIVMDGGAISAVGTHDELMQSSEIYREVYTSQNKAGETAMANKNVQKAHTPANPYCSA